MDIRKKIQQSKTINSFFFFLKKGKNFFLLCFQFGKEKKLTSLAQSLAYTTILTLVPIFVLFFSILGRITQDKAEKEYITQFISTYFIPQYGDVILQKLEELSSGSAALAGVGAPLLLLICGLLYLKVDSAMDHIWGADDKKKWYSNWRVFFMTMLVAPVLLLLAISVPPYLSTLPYYQDILSYGFTDWLVSSLLPILVATSGFYVLYVYLPSTSVQYSACFWGALFAGVSLQVSNFLLSWYLSSFSNFNIIYGSLAIFPIFLIWIYIAWLIVLVGNAMSFVIQNYADTGFIRVERDVVLENQSLLCSAINVVTYIVKCFQNKNGAPDFHQIKFMMGVEDQRLNYILRVLQEEKLITAFQERKIKGNIIQRFQPAFLPTDLFIEDLIPIFYKEDMVSIEPKLDKLLESFNMHPIIREIRINFQDLVTHPEKLLPPEEKENKVVKIS